MTALETIAKAYVEVPGFARLMWSAVDALHAAHFRIEQANEYKATHKKPSGSRWSYIKRSEVASGERFMALTDALNCILEAAFPDYSDWMYSVLLEEIHTTKKIVRWSYASNMSMTA